MSNKSGVASQVMSLPSGGGALQGIGETFAPDLFTGTGNLTVPITVPTGRNGFQPTLSLSYSSGNGNGPFGLGWALSAPEVTRKTSRGVPRYLDDATNPVDHDTFLLSGAEDLVPIGQPSVGTTTRFRPRTEGLFARIEHHRHGGDFWTVRTKDGLINHYGAAGSTEAVQADPQDPSKIFCWKLTETTDPFGNRIRYEYRQDRSEEGLHAWNQLYLENIRYCDYGDDAFLVSVTFLYEDQPVSFSNHRAGFEIRTRLRCKRIEVRTHPNNENHLIRSVDLIYLDDRVHNGDLDPGLLPHNGVSLLSRIRVAGHDGPDIQELPPIDFGYTAFAPENRPLQRIKGRGSSLTRRSLADENLELVSLFGNGLPDIVEMDGGTRFWRNLGSGTYDEPRTMPEVPVGVRLSDPGTQFGDLNGDGRADLLTLDRGGYFPLSFTGRWSPRGFVRYQRAPLVPFGDGNMRLVDLDGDGVVDALRTGQNFELFFNDPSQGWDRVETRPRGPMEEFPDVSFDNPQVKLADLSGDGLQDIVLIDQRRIDYWPNLGHGRWGARITMANSPFFDDEGLSGAQFDPRRVLLGDVDGDGLDDIVYVEPDRVTIWINQNGNACSDPLPPIKNTPRFPDIDAVRLVDLHGTGTAGILWTSNSPGSTLALHRFLDLTGAVKPYLLETMTNNIGAVTRIRYAPSTKFYLADEQTPTPWQTPLPFPVQVVERTEVIDEISRTKLTTSFHYHHGYWDGAEREFRGFGRVDQLDTEQSVEDFNQRGLDDNDSPVDVVNETRFSPPLLTKRWFHLGPIGDEFTDRLEADLTGEYWPGDPPFLPRPSSTSKMLESLKAAHFADALRTLRGGVLRSEVYAKDGTERQENPFTVTEFQYGIREESPPVDGDSNRRRIFFPHAGGQRTTQWERGTDPLTQFSFTDLYDEYGMDRRQITLAVPRGRDFRAPAAAGSPYLGAVTTTTYAQRDDDLYIVDRIASVTTQEIVNDGGLKALGLHDAVVDGTARLVLIGQTLNYYDGPPLKGLPLEKLGDFGALVRTANLVLTDDILEKAFHDEVNDVVLPPYLAPAGPPAWTEEYPEGFRDLTPPHAGYIISPIDASQTRGYYVQQTRHRYDFHTDPATSRGLLTGIQDQLGGEAHVDYDDFALLPVRITDAAGMTKEIIQNYRALRPGLITDENGNRTAYTYAPLGLLASTIVMGKDGEDVGDTLTAPSTRMVYDFGQKPIAVHTIRRVAHTTDTSVPAGDRDKTIKTVEYSDGCGRLVQARVQAEDVQWGDPLFGLHVLPGEQNDSASQSVITGRMAGSETNVVVSGWQLYDNKGRVIEKYEPFYSTGWNYASSEEAQRGQKVTMRYDPRGRPVSTLYPDGSEETLVYGVPGDLSDPDRFTPTPWELYIYDVNDNAGRTSAVEAVSYRHHWNTPTSIIVDALGRTVWRTDRHRDPKPDSSVSEVRAGFTYDVSGNVTGVTDALGRSAVRYVHDHMGRPWVTENIDEGAHRIVWDAAGNDVESRDSKGALLLQSVDALWRPIRQWARDDLASETTLRERLEYGDGGDARQPAEERTANKSANRLGKIHRHFDEAGLVVMTAYDFKNNLIDQTRRVITDQALTAVFPDPGHPTPDWKVTSFRVNWEPPAEMSLDVHSDSILENTAYQTSCAYDALNRISTALFPADVTGRRSELRPAYNRAGGLERVQLDGQSLVSHIAYNATGQRTFVALGNGILTRYAFDHRNRRLRRLRSERYIETSPTSYNLTGPALQDIAYAYDLAGNMLELIDRTPGSGIRGNPEAGLASDPTLIPLLAAGDAFVRRFQYDPLYRLTSATGRECSANQANEPWTDEPRCGFPGIPNPENAINLTHGYAEKYQYDAAGNLLELRHGNGGGAAVRRLALAPGTNRIQTLTTGSATITYTFDATGNMTGETASRHFEWDHSDRLKAFVVQAGSAEPSVHTQYLYDSAGERVKKLTRRQGGNVGSITYVGDLFEHQRWNIGGNPGANTYLHVMDGDQRIALVRRGPSHPSESGPSSQYHLGDHLGSSSVVLDADGGFINREEYTPYGETSFGSFGRKRYRFTSKERDEESGLYYHGARYYVPWLGRWASTDPSGLMDNLNGYAYARGRPTTLVDSNGLQSAPSSKANDVVPYNEKLVNPRSGGLRLEKDHVIAKGKQRLINPAIKTSKQLTVVQDTGAATNGVPAKPHTQATFHDVQADVREIRRLQSLKPGEWRSFEAEIVTPSLNSRYRSGYSQSSTNVALLDEIGTMFEVDQPNRAPNSSGPKLDWTESKSPKGPAVNPSTGRVMGGGFGLLRKVASGVLKALTVPELGAITADNHGDAIAGILASYLAGTVVASITPAVAAGASGAAGAAGSLAVPGLALVGKQGGLTGAGHMYSKGFGHNLRNPASALLDSQRAAEVRARIVDSRRR